MLSDIDRRPYVLLEQSTAFIGRRGANAHVSALPAAARKARGGRPVHDLDAGYFES